MRPSTPAQRLWKPFTLLRSKMTAWRGSDAASAVASHSSRRPVIASLNSPK